MRRVGRLPAPHPYLVTPRRSSPGAAIYSANLMTGPRRNLVMPLHADSRPLQVRDHKATAQHRSRRRVTWSSSSTEWRTSLPTLSSRAGEARRPAAPFTRRIPSDRVEHGLRPARSHFGQHKALLDAVFASERQVLAGSPRETDLGAPTRYSTHTTHS